MALTALKRTAEEGAKECPEAARVLHENTYVDDICISLYSREAKKWINDVDKVAEKGSFKVKEWVSNLNLGDEDTRPQQDNRPVFKCGSEQKVLGVVWEPDRDLLLYKVSAAEIRVEEVLTKRMVAE
ncbi:hypothetical protein HOLleu_04445 [Holothuria leucospilota]|uniref:Uncharacterized protein n=1 Tax=Holothuria leucospilota TaxID=206669 RepID=A0A9Q1HMD6_HOLLE|nr:hypothetical protein HOLleu_04445 [Holothuria leucospilota]